MSSTHYMDLLMQNSPWNLILFMAIPVVLAETIAITELLIPLLSERAEMTKKVNRVCGYLRVLHLSASSFTSFLL